MTIKVGDRIPSAKLVQVGPDGAREVTTEEIFGGKTVVLFAVPGAFTPTCSIKHLPGFLEHLDALQAKGVDTVACLAVNDQFVMEAWAKSQNALDKIMFLADGSGLFTKALGLEFDLTARGLGIRAQRFAMIVKDGVVTHLGVEEPGGFEVSKAEAVLAAL